MCIFDNVYIVCHTRLSLMQFSIVEMHFLNIFEKITKCFTSPRWARPSATKVVQHINCFSIGFVMNTLFFICCYLFYWFFIGFVKEKTVLISCPCVLIGCYWLFIGFVRTTMDLICCSLVRICVCPQALVFFINGWCVLPNISVPIYMRGELCNRC